MNNTLDGINSRSNVTEENINEPEDKAIETIQNETPRENKKHEQNISDLIGQLEFAQYAYIWSL